MKFFEAMVLGAFFHFSAYCETNIIFSNNTSEQFQISSQLIDNSSNLEFGTDFNTVSQKFIDSYYSNVKVLNFNSNVNIKWGVDYHFNVSIENKNYLGQKLEFFITTHGLFTGSKITETYLIMPNTGNKISLSEVTNIIVPTWGNEVVHFVPFEMKQNEVPWPSFVLSVDKEQFDPFNFSSINSFKGMNYNVQMWPIYGDIANPPNNKYVRANDLPLLIADNYDYVSLNEVFDKDIRAQLIKSMSKKNYPYFVDAAGMNSLKALSSGVVTFSKWPILTSDSYVYDSCKNEDCLAAKGITYIKMSKNMNGLQEIYNIFSTHLQAGDSSWEQRAEQINELHRFIVQQNIPIHEAVLISGDLNVNKFNTEKHTYAGKLMTEYEFLLEELNATDPKNIGLTYSWDGVLNTMAALSDSSRSKLDYILYLNDYKLPKTSVNIIQPLRDTSNSSLYPIYDTSDHFPVIGEFVF